MTATATATPARLSVRQAAEAAGVSRAAARSAVEAGLVPARDLGPADVVVLRAASCVRSLLFPGEIQPANRERGLRDRDRQVAAGVLQLYREMLPGVPAVGCLIVCADRVQVAADQGALVTQTLEAAGRHEAFHVLPVAAWIATAKGGQPLQ